MDANADSTAARPPASPRAKDRRTRWMIAGIGFNTLASLTAIALWAAAPRGAGTAQCPPIETSIAGASWPPAAAGPRRAPLSGAAPAANRPPPAGWGDEPPLRVSPELLSRRPAAATAATPVSPALAALAERLHFNAAALAGEVGDEHGELPRAVADRLERGHDAGVALAKRLGLDEDKASSLAGVFTYHVVSLLREEKKAAPGNIDPSKLDELTATTLDGIRAVCGEAAADAATRELDDL
jgi:hypothetical protein